MATLVFGALGTLVGGPIGGAIGALIGREADRAIIGTPVREGPRLKELAVSASSYGQPIARQFGAMRAAGTIMWATELKESRERMGGGKGQPATDAFSYSVSLAIALWSRPIEGVGRIWADGNLLRGAVGDFKTGGSMRIYRGHADQPRDPLLAAALGAECPAHRGLAYVVIEDLQLADFGNRIPALSFEVFASGGGAELIPALVADAGVRVAAQPLAAAAEIGGFAHEGGSVAQMLELLAETMPIVADAGADGLAIGPPGTVALELPEAVASSDDEFGSMTGVRRSRRGDVGPGTLRYYDAARDYQPGLQRATGRAQIAGERVLELPAILSPTGARGLIDAVRLRAGSAGDTMQVRVAALDPAVAPGALVTSADGAIWQVDSWEWRSSGVELGLRRALGAVPQTALADGGSPWRPADRLPATTILAAFELPWDSSGAPDAARVHAAVGASAGRWAGAALYLEQDGALKPLISAGAARALTGRLESALSPHRA